MTSGSVISRMLSCFFILFEIRRTWLEQLEAPRKRPPPWRTRSCTKLMAYVLEQQLGEGSFGRVVAAKNSSNGQRFALKIFKDRDEALLEKEVRDLIPSHRHILPLFELIEQPGVPAGIAMPLCTCDLRSCGKLRPPMFQKYAWQLLHGLSYMHQSGVIHRDLHTKNILCQAGTAEGDPEHQCDIVLIADFGLSCSMPPCGYLTRATEEEVCALRYRAPELLLCPKYSYQADSWACGCVLGFMAAGQDVFSSFSDQGSASTHSGYEQVLAITRILGPPPLAGGFPAASVPSWIGLGLATHLHAAAPCSLRVNSV